MPARWPSARKMRGFCAAASGAPFFGPCRARRARASQPARSADRQFDDCNLTLKQLDTIAEVVAQRILSNLHTRVAYPSMREEKKVDNVIPMAGKME